MSATGRGAPAPSATADREIVISRVISAPRERDAVRFNIEGAQRLMLSIPPGRLATCWTWGAAPGGRPRP